MEIKGPKVGSPDEVWQGFLKAKNISEKDLESVGYTYFKKDDKWGISDLACDFIYLGNNNINFKISLWSQR